MLAVITSFFNVSGNPHLSHNYHQFKRQVDNFPFYVIEMSNNRKLETNAILTLRVQDNQVLWQKERMLNLLADQLPKEITSIAWVDADVLFLHPDWYQQTIRALEVNPVVQMWSNAHFSNKDGSLDRTFRSSGLAGGYSARVPRPHCGFAWAMRREIWDKIDGLFEFDIVGGSDAWMAHAFFGERSGNFLRQSSRAMLMEFSKYYERCQEVIKGNVGCVTGDITHMYHGEWEDRKYWQRHLIMRDCKYNPTLDIKTGMNGLHEWTGKNPDLINRVSAMLQAGHYKKELANL